MELLCFGLLIFLAIGIAKSAIEKQQRERERLQQAEESTRLETLRRAQHSDARWMGAELVRLVDAADVHGIQPLVEALPAWPVRAALLNASQWLAVLTRGVGMAEPAGVPAAMVQDLYNSIEGTKAVLNSVVVKMVSLANQSGLRWKRLPDEARRWLDSDTRMLRAIESAAASLHESLAVAIAAGEQGGRQRGRQSGHTLHALAEAISDLSRPSR